MVDGAGAELPVELLGPQTSEVLDGEGPEVQDVVPGEGVSLLQQHHLGPQQSQLDGRAQAAWSGTDDQTLPAGEKNEKMTRRGPKITPVTIKKSEGINQRLFEFQTTLTCTVL